MATPHPGRTNQQAFDSAFEQLTGVDLSHGSPADTISTFYRECFPTLHGSHQARPGAVEAVATARSLGLKTVLATNPIFPLIAIEERMRWAGLALADFDLVTSYEIAPACKPDPTYFAWVAESIGVDPTRCLMVGDDAAMDMPASALGMRTYYVGPDKGVVSDDAGDLQDLLRGISAWLTAGN